MTFQECLQRFNLEKAVEMMHNGASQKDMAKEFGILPQRVSDCFKFYGVPFDRRGLKINDTYFDEIDTEEKAYLLGFLVADGCCRLEKRKTHLTKRIAFNNTIDDKEAIEAMHNAICPQSSLLVKHYTFNRRKKPQYTLQWTSPYMFDKLGSKYNIKPHKTLDKDFFIPDGVIPNELWRHFVRRFFDGDGHIGFNSLEFVFNSKPFMNQILETFKNFTYRVYHVKGKTTDYWKVVINLNDKERKVIKDFFYKDSALYLKRKHADFNTEITYQMAYRVIGIVEHRAE